jgi:quinoprotein dehydrogenase-associated probable ABC transporter substrate-binding protein
MNVIAATTEVRDRTALRVCADPANVPFSNEAGEGFENKIAELVAAELGLPVHYTWFPQATGFIRNTLGARKCDVVIGIALGSELVQNTNPYYRSTFSLVYRADSGLVVDTLGDPVLKNLRLGVVARTPPATLMAKYGLLGNVRPYQLFVDTRFDLSGKKMVEDVANGDLDVAVLWGPIAGYFAGQHNPKLQVVPLTSVAGDVKLDYRITMGVRQNEVEWRHQLNAIIREKQPEINAILLAYGVPLLDEQGNPITHRPPIQVAP